MLDPSSNVVADGSNESPRIKMSRCRADWVRERVSGSVGRVQREMESLQTASDGVMAASASAT